jgi:redox-sensitive bicupin YhaK (pirin superfamily)
MLTRRPAHERGHANFGWLDTHHTFSFGRYYDPEHLGFRALRVINDDVIAPDAGFPFHGHENMEIISYVTKGALEHKDSMGNGSVIRPGDVQIMSAGTGVEHSEFNHLKDGETHLFQIWIHPREKGLAPNYQEKHFDASELENALRLIVSPDGRDGSLTIQQDTFLYAARLRTGQQVSHPLDGDRHAWIQVLSGSVTVNGHRLDTGDGLAVSDAHQLELVARDDAEVLVFDLA